jgi:hypothetical protein
MAEQLQPPAVRELDREFKGVICNEPEIVGKDGRERLQLFSTVLPQILKSQCPSPSESSKTSILSV